MTVFNIQFSVEINVVCVLSSQYAAYKLTQNDAQVRCLLSVEYTATFFRCSRITNRTMRKNIFLTAFLVLNMIGLACAGQDTSYFTSSVQWDLATTIAYAKQNNIQVNITRLDEKLSAQDLLFARAARYPNLSGSATQSLTHSGNTN